MSDPLPLPLPLPVDLLLRSAEEGARRVLLHTLARTESALHHLSGHLSGQLSGKEARSGDPAASEALHDFRVGVRRVRSQLRAFRRLLGDREGKAVDRLARRFRDLARATNPGRDAEVQAHALERIASGKAPGNLSPGLRRAARSLASDLRTRFRSESEEALPGARGDFERAAVRLRARLSKMQFTVTLDPLVAIHEEAESSARSQKGAHAPGRFAPSFQKETFGAALAEAVAEELAETQSLLARVKGIEPPEPLHEARIVAKRLRYLLEAARDADPAVAPALQGLKSLQDLLGEFHDAEILGGLAARELRGRVRKSTRATIEEVRLHGLGSTARRLRRVPDALGLLELVDLARQRRLAAWRAIRRERAALGSLWRRIEAITSRWAGESNPDGGRDLSDQSDRSDLPPSNDPLPSLPAPA